MAGGAFQFIEDDGVDAAGGRVREHNHVAEEDAARFCGFDYGFFGSPSMRY
jgi:hypothetical protein